MGLLLLLGGGKPVIRSGPDDVTTQPGLTATFTVIASYARRYQWAVSIDGGNSFEELEAATSASYTTASLSLIDDNGKKYRVAVSNSDGVVISRAALLTVTDVELPEGE